MSIEGKIWVSADYPHIRIPKRMLHDQHYRLLSPEAKIIYGSMMDRLCLSHKNQDKFKNRNGELFIYFTQDEIMRLLGCGHDKASKIEKELVKENLIEVRRRGVGRPYEIVLRPMDWQLQRKKRNEQSEKSLWNSDKNDCSLCGNSDGNNTEDNNLENIDPEYYLCRYFIHQIEYDELVREHNPDVVNKIVDIIANTICQDMKSILIGNMMLSADMVKEKFWEINKDHILYVLRNLKDSNCTNKYSETSILNLLYESTLI